MNSASAKKKGKWQLAKCSVDEGVINTIKLPGEKKGHNYQGNSPFLLGPLWPPQSKIDNMVEGGCSVAAHVLHLLFFASACLPLPCLYSNERNYSSFKKTTQNYEIVLHFTPNKKF